MFPLKWWGLGMAEMLFIYSRARPQAAPSLVLTQMQPSERESPSPAKQPQKPFYLHNLETTCLPNTSTCQ